MNDNEAELNCPTCGKKSQYLIDWEYSGLNNSIFNYTADLFECSNCGLVYIANITDKKLSIFYTKECLYFQESHFDISAPENIQKYKYYREIIVSAGLSDSPITDVGCGRGGFLIWLKNNTWNGNCQGIDIDLKSLPDMRANTREQGTSITFQEGTAFALPFANRSQSLLTYFNVLEHIVNLDKAFKEAFRVLRESGDIMIEVPDAERYKDFPIGTAFWPSIRQHIYHFSTTAICNILYRNGFDVISIHRNLLPTPDFLYPSLIILARKNYIKRKPEICKTRDIVSFIIQSKKDLKAQALRVLKFSSKLSLLTFWGCSEELFSLLPILNLQKLRICDSNKIKQKSHYKGIPIQDPNKIKKNGGLIVAPYQHRDAIKKAAIKLGWPKEAILHLI